MFPCAFPATASFFTPVCCCRGVSTRQAVAPLQVYANASPVRCASLRAPVTHVCIERPHPEKTPRRVERTHATKAHTPTCSRLRKDDGHQPATCLMGRNGGGGGRRWQGGGETNAQWERDEEMRHAWKDAVRMCWAPHLRPPALGGTPDPKFAPQAPAQSSCGVGGQAPKLGRRTRRIACPTGTTLVSVTDPPPVL